MIWNAHVLSDGSQLYSSTLGSGDASEPVAIPGTSGALPDSVESAATPNSTRALITYECAGISYAIVVDGSGAIGAPVQLGPGSVDPYAGENGALIAVSSDGDDERFVYILAPSASAFSPPVPLPNPGGSFRVSAAAVTARGELLIAEMAEFGGSGLVVWARRPGADVQPRYILSTGPPLLQRRPWVALVADPSAWDETVKLVPARHGDTFAALWSVKDPGLGQPARRCARRWS